MLWIFAERFFMAALRQCEKSEGCFAVFTAQPWTAAVLFKLQFSDGLLASCCRSCRFAFRVFPRSALRNTPPTSEYPLSACAEEVPQSGKRSAGKTSRLETLSRQWPPLNHGWLRL